MRTAGICQGPIQAFGLDRDPTCLGFPSALGEAGRIIMLDCQGPCTPQGPDAKDCFPFLGGWALPARRKFQAPAAGEGVDPATTPCDHIPAAQTVASMASFLFSFSLGKGTCPGPRGEVLSSFCLLRSTLSLPLSLPAFAVQAQRHSPMAGASGTTPTRGLLIPLRDVCRSGGWEDRGLVSSGTLGFLFGNLLLRARSHYSLNPFPWLCSLVARRCISEIIWL